MLFECIKKGTAPNRVVEFAKDYLKGKGFEELYFHQIFYPVSGGKYYISPYPDVLFAFTVASNRNYLPSMRMAFAHVDQPCFKIKGKPDMRNAGCKQLNVEVYGGMTDHTWFDRPLGIAGTIAIRSDDVFHPTLVSYDSKRAVAMIPGLAIHMKREMNDGWRIDRQKELMPVVGLGKQWTEGSFQAFLGAELELDPSEILSYDLCLYNYEEPQYVGMEEDFILSPRLDNLVSCAALLEAITQSDREDGLNLIGLYNYEEVGSVSTSGADSDLLKLILEQIFRALNGNADCLPAILGQSYFLSVDAAHAAHPNYLEKADPTTRAIMGEGTVIKTSGSTKYASNCTMKAIVSGLAEKYDILVQEIADRNTIRGGSTLGSMIQSHLPMDGCDIGIPMWAMHSAQESIARSDYESLSQLVTAFMND